MKSTRAKKDTKTDSTQTQNDMSSNSFAKNTIVNNLNSNLLDQFNGIVQLAATTTHSPIAFLGLFDQSEKCIISSVGLNARTLGAINLQIEQEDVDQEIQIVENIKIANDQKLAPWLQDIPLITFYAKFNIFDVTTKTPIGALCVLDSIQKNLTSTQTSSLKILGRLAQTQLKSLDDNGLSIINFAQKIAHDINTPLTTISLAAGQIQNLLTLDPPDIKKAIVKSKSIEGTVKKVSTIIGKLKSISDA